MYPGKTQRMQDKDRPDLKRGQKRPSNPRLWEMVVAQAKTRFSKYPSITAQKWVHDEYVNRGGRFVGSVKEDDLHDHRGKRRTDRLARRADRIDERTKKARGDDDKKKQKK